MPRVPHIPARPVGRLTLLGIAILGCAKEPARRAERPVASPLHFAVLEDYDRGESLALVARDFARFRELGIPVWRGSLGWDDYEPQRGRYDFEWLEQFLTLADTSGIAVRPYVGYTPAWAAAGRRGDSAVWNDPPRDTSDWRRFVDTLTRVLRRHPSVRSVEIYNEQNVPLWWDGSAEEYAVVFAVASRTVRALAPRLPILMGGLVWPDADFTETVCTQRGNADRLDVLPLHNYAETWTPDSIIVDRATGAEFTEWVGAADRHCGRKPIWINETGFATYGGRTEAEQAAWWVRAVATFASHPRVEHIGVYEIRDLPAASDVIGDGANRHLGLIRLDGTPKVAFATVRLLQTLFAGGRTPLTPPRRVLAPADTSRTRVHLFARGMRADSRDRTLIAWTQPDATPQAIALVLGDCPSRLQSFDAEARVLPPPPTRRDTLTLSLVPNAPVIVTYEAVPCR